MGGGDQNFLGWSKGVTRIFSVGQRGDQNFLRVIEGGPEFFPGMGTSNFTIYVRGCSFKGGPEFLHICQGSKCCQTVPSTSIGSIPGHTRSGNIINITFAIVRFSHSHQQYCGSPLVRGTLPCREGGVDHIWPLSI